MRRWTAAAYLIIAIPLLTPLGEAATITLHPAVQVDGPRVTLGQVAAITGAGEGAARQLAALDLGAAPWPGSARRIGGLVVKLKLYQSGIDPKAVIIDPKAACRLTTRGREIPAERIIELARQHLLRSVQWPRKNLQVTLSSKPAGVTVPFGCGEDALRPAANVATKRLGLTNIAVDVVVDGARRFRENVTFDVRLFENAVIAKQDIARGDALAAANVELQRVELKHWPSTQIAQLDEAIGSKALRPIAAGTPVAASMIAMPPLVRRGRPVKLIYRVRCLQLTASGIARQDGARGEVISVENDVSRKRLTGTVIGAGEVLIRS